jgi:hypothetical protein
LDDLGVDEGFVKCCKGTLPSEPYATGESEAERAARHKQEAAQLKAACDKRGAAWQWDSGSNQCKTVPCPEGQIRREGKCQQVGVLPGSTTGKKGGFIQMKPNCAEGFVWSESANNCVASPAAEKQTSDDDDYKPQKKKKKKKGQYEDDGGYQKKKKKQRDYDDDDDGDRY